MNSKDIKKNIIYVSSQDYIDVCDLHPKVLGRASLVHNLIKAYDLYEKMEVVSPRICSKTDLLAFHTSDYVECLSSIQKYFEENVDDKPGKKEFNLDYSDLMEDVDVDIISHGLGYDCQVFPNMLKYVQCVVGATLTAADVLMKDQADISINLNGGWHHAHVDEVAGFCYVNDIVIGILHLQKKFKKILYIDFDIHHGDGVEEAFKFSQKVFTLSVHRLSEGFFPGTGSIDECGLGNGKYYAINVPLKTGIQDEKYELVFSKIYTQLVSAFEPEVIVCQCGADMLNGDPLGGFNLTESCLSNCMRKIVESNVPILVLGGGGYNLPNTAKCWTTLIADLVEVKIDDNIPEHEFLEQYGPDFSICISPSNRKDENDDMYITKILNKICENIRALAPISDDDEEEDVIDKENQNTFIKSEEQPQLADKEFNSPPAKRRVLEKGN